jgi:hypothetical protein
MKITMSENIDFSRFNFQKFHDAKNFKSFLEILNSFLEPTTTQDHIHSILQFHLKQKLKFLTQKKYNSKIKEFKSLNNQLFQTLSRQYHYQIENRTLFHLIPLEIGGTNIAQNVVPISSKLHQKFINIFQEYFCSNSKRSRQKIPITQHSIVKTQLDSSSILELENIRFINPEDLISLNKISNQ